MRRVGSGRSERGSVVEALLWAGAALGVAGLSAYVVLAKPWQEKPIELTPEQEAYVQAVATQQAASYIEAVATMQANQASQAAAAPAQAQAAPPQSTNYEPPAQQPAPQQPAQPQAPSQPAAPSQPSQPSQPPPPPAPTATPTPKPPPPPPPPTQPPAPPPPPSGGNKPPTAACVGYMAGLSSDGYQHCVDIVLGSNYNMSHCVGHIIGSPGITDGPGSCVQVALQSTEANLGDCLMGLSGQSLFGMTSCRLYYESH